MTNIYIKALEEQLEIDYPQTQGQQTLTIQNIRFKVFMPRTVQLFSQYKDLKSLSIRHCDLRNLDNFPRLQVLQDLDISHNQLQGTFNNLMPLKTLKFINVESNIIFESIKLAPLRKISHSSSNSKEKSSANFKLTVCITNNPFTQEEKQSSYLSKFKTYNLKVVKEAKQYYEKKKQDQEKEKNKKQRTERLKRKKANGNRGNKNKITDSKNKKNRRQGDQQIDSFYSLSQQESQVNVDLQEELESSSSPINPLVNNRQLSNHMERQLMLESQIRNQSNHLRSIYSRNSMNDRNSLMNEAMLSGSRPTIIRDMLNGENGPNRIIVRFGSNSSNNATIIQNGMGLSSRFSDDNPFLGFDQIQDEDDEDIELSQNGIDDDEDDEEANDEEVQQLFRVGNSDDSDNNMILFNNIRTSSISSDRSLEPISRINPLIRSNQSDRLLPIRSTLVRQQEIESRLRSYERRLQRLQQLRQLQRERNALASQLNRGSRAHDNARSYQRASLRREANEMQLMRRQIERQRHERERQSMRQRMNFGRNPSSSSRNSLLNEMNNEDFNLFRANERRRTNESSLGNLSNANNLDRLQLQSSNGNQAGNSFGNSLFSRQGSVPNNPSDQSSNPFGRTDSDDEENLNIQDGLQNEIQNQDQEQEQVPQYDDDNDENQNDGQNDDEEENEMENNEIQSSEGEDIEYFLGLNQGRQVQIDNLGLLDDNFLPNSDFDFVIQDDLMIEPLRNVVQDEEDQDQNDRQNPPSEQQNPNEDSSSSMS